MRTLFWTTTLLLAAASGTALADEGWGPDSAWLERVRLASIRLTSGCSASLVSPDGLVMTNHHCVRECVSDLADAAHDYIAKGFYASKLEDERKCPELEA